MSKNEKKEELQSRRQFFKKAAKSALPFLGVFVFASNPLFAKAMEAAPSGCKGSCYGSCRNACESCKYTCLGGCKNACDGCQYTCLGTCKNACQGCKYSCSGSNK